ncbi:MAG: FGGY family carbohydrate kinase [Armatimonadota bacterium]
MPQVVVIDCGSTNIRAIAVDEQGQIIASAGRPNEAVPQLGAPKGHIIWNLQQLWGKICDVCHEVAAQAPDVRAVTLTTWGADGAPVRDDGSLAYLPICWQDNRTEDIIKRIDEYLPAWDLYRLTGYQVIPFDTLLRFIWLRENQPAALEGTQWLMMPGLLSFMLCGEKSIERTAAGTMMALDMAKEDWSPQLLGLAGLDTSFFPRWVQPGDVIGSLTAQAAHDTGLPAGIPVVACGHDTQFAAIGSGAQANEAILSSGTWEILMLRQEGFQATREGFDNGVLIECDAVPGLFNPQLLMMGSGVLEWIRNYFYTNLGSGPDAFATLAAEADTAGPGAGGVTVLPSFVSSTGPAKRYGTQGTVLGLTITTEPGQVYRAALEGLTFQMRHALEVVKSACGVDPKVIRVVGGGSKNDLWNQLRADLTGLPIITIDQKEATVVGAAMFAFLGAGEFGALDQAQAAMTGGLTTIEPSGDCARYEALYGRYRQVQEDLSSFHGV